MIVSNIWLIDYINNYQEIELSKLFEDLIKFLN